MTAPSGTSTDTRVPVTVAVREETSKARSAMSSGSPVTSGVTTTREFAQNTDAAIAPAMSATLTAAAMIAERGMRARRRLGADMVISIAIGSPGLSPRTAAGMLRIRRARSRRSHARIRLSL